MKYQDGTTSTSTHDHHHQPLSEDDKQWLEQALKGAMLDLSNRMMDINNVLTDRTTTTSPATLQEKERLLDELMEIVESIDQAKDLSTVGGLPTLLHLLSSSHPSLRWRAAEVLATCCQNNPEVQQVFFDNQVLQHLVPLLDDDTTDTTVRVKALLALSCQIRGHTPSLSWFMNVYNGGSNGGGGIAKLVFMLKSENGGNSNSGGGDDRIVRKCLQLLDYLFLHTSSSSSSVDIRNKLIVVLTKTISSTADVGDVRGAALQLISTLLRCCSSSDSRAFLEQHEGEILAAAQSVLVKLDVLPKDEWGTAEEEAALAKKILIDIQRVKNDDNLSRNREIEEEGGGDDTSAPPPPLLLSAPST